MDDAREPFLAPRPGEAAVVMAIVNRTPDSFHDGGATFDLERAVAAGERAVADGAQWIDVGGVPFSPDATPVGPAEEIDRVAGLVARLVDTGAVISVDTTRAEVAAACLAAGARVINDTSGLHDPDLAGVVARAGAGLVLTHSLAAPGQHWPRPHYDDVVGEVVARLGDLLRTALAAGIDPRSLVLDPGPDLNKSTPQTLALLRGIGSVVALGQPVLAAVSHKDFVGETVGRGPAQRLAGTLAATAWCLERGVAIVRTHDVAATVDVVRMLEALRGRAEPLGPLRHNV